MCFFFTYTCLSPSQQSLRHRQPHVNEIAVTDAEEGYSNTQDATCSKNSNVTDLLTIFTKPLHPRHLMRP